MGRKKKKGYARKWIIWIVIILSLLGGALYLKNNLYFDRLLKNHQGAKPFLLAWMRDFFFTPSKITLNEGERDFFQTREMNSDIQRSLPGKEDPFQASSIKKRQKQKTGPVVALVIDDLGYNRPLAQALLSIDMTLTVSVLPHHPFSKECAEKAHEKAWEVILHLPMQPRECASRYWEKNTLQIQMSQKDILQIIDLSLKNVPWAVGVNNHMGSLMLEDKRSMQVILTELKNRGLYFLDSRTTPNSIGYQLAQSLGVPSACRHVFLDHKKDLPYIQGQITTLIERALKDGKAIGIGHLHSKTIQALKAAAARFQERGITLVRLSEVME